MPLVTSVLWHKSRLKSPKRYVKLVFFKFSGTNLGGARGKLWSKEGDKCQMGGLVDFLPDGEPKKPAKYVHILIIYVPPLNTAKPLDTCQPKILPLDCTPGKFTLSWRKSTPQNLGDLIRFLVKLSIPFTNILKCFVYCTCTWPKTASLV